jgi:hypothetical protein
MHTVTVRSIHAAFPPLLRTSRQCSADCAGRHVLGPRSGGGLAVLDAGSLYTLEKVVVALSSIIGPALRNFVFGEGGVRLGVPKFAIECHGRADKPIRKA